MIMIKDIAYLLNKVLFEYDSLFSLEILILKGFQNLILHLPDANGAVQLWQTMFFLLSKAGKVTKSRKRSHFSLGAAEFLSPHKDRKRQYNQLLL